MYKVMITATVLLGLALTPFLTGTVEHQDPRDVHQDDVAPADAAVQAEPVVDSAVCEWDCQACTAEQGCLQTCAEIGDCGSSCGVMARCDDAHRWDDSSCGCVAR